MSLQETGKLDKGWGYEIVWSNNDSYCGKILIFEKAGAKTSMVFHKEKKKSWFVNAGQFKVSYIDIESGEIKVAYLEEGQTADFAELSPHQVEALVPNSVIFEVGTSDIAEDRFRLSPGDSQKQKAEQRSTDPS